VGGALLSISSLRRCISCLSSVGSTCDDEPATYSGAEPCAVCGDWGGNGGSGFDGSLSSPLTGGSDRLGCMVCEDSVRIVLVSSSVMFVTRRCNDGDDVMRDDNIGEDVARNGGGGWAEVEDDEATAT